MNISAFPAWSRAWLSVFVVLSVLQSSRAQTYGGVTGTVLDSETGSPLVGANVYLEPIGKGSVTDGSGYFRIEVPRPGDFILVARFVGYQTVRQSLTLESASSVRVELRLKPEPILLQGAVVSATRERQSRAEIPLSIGSADRDAIEAANPSHPSDIMSRIAGVWVNQTSGEGHMTAIRQPLSTAPLYLYLENGVPTRSTGFFNHNALNEINVPQAETIEVIKGPGTALYGSDAIGGVINVSSRPAPLNAEATLAVEAGSYGFKRALISAGTTVGRDGLRLDVNLTDSEGWRHDTEYSRQSAAVRWDRRIGSASVLRTVASFSHVDQGPAGISAVSEADFHNNPRLNYQPISYRKVQAYRLSAAFERYSPNALLSITPFMRFNTMDLLPNWSLTFDPTIWETQNYSVGALLKYRKDFDAMRGRVIVGTDLDVSPGERIEIEIDPAREGQIFTSYEVVGTIYDYDVTYRQAAPYGHVEASPTDRLRLSAGLRIDYVGYDYENNLSVAQVGPHRRPESTSLSFTHFSPKLGLTYQIGRAASGFAAYRHAFRVPSESQLFRQGSSVNTVDLKPVKVDNYEAGIRGRMAGTFDVEMTAYYMKKTDDIVPFVFADGTRGSVNAGETSHQGIEIGVGSSPVKDVDLSLSYSHAVHRYEDWETQIDEDFSGNEMEVAPRTILNASITYRIPVLDGASVALEWNRLGSYWMDAENTSKYGGHDLLNVLATLRFAENLTLRARVGNLTDELYAERATYNQFRGDEFAPGLPRTIHVALQYGL